MDRARYTKFRTLSQAVNLILKVTDVGGPITITTGRRLLEDAATGDNLVVMLDGSLLVSDDSAGAIYRISYEK